MIENFCFVHQIAESNWGSWVLESNYYIKTTTTAYIDKKLKAL